MLNLTRLVAVSKKEMQEILRDPITLMIAIAMPLIMMYLFSYAITLDVKKIPMGIVDEDRSSESREYLARFLRSSYFSLQASLQSIKEAEDLLDGGSVRLVIIIPSGFSRDLDRGRRAEIQTLLDGSFPNTAIIALNYVDAITQGYALRLQGRVLETRLGRIPSISPAIQVRSRVRYNPELRSENYIISGLFAVVLMAFPPLLTALTVVRERERGSIQQIYTSPIHALEFLWGKLIPYSLIAFAEMLLLLVAAVLWFQVPVRGSVPLLITFSLFYVVSSCAIGILVSTWTKNQVVALLLAILITFMPAFLFSGFIYAIDSMPLLFQVYTYIFPARYFMEASRGIMLKGAGLRLLWLGAVILIVYSVALLALASQRFQKRLG